MKRHFKVLPILLLIVSLFSCNTTKGQVANNNVTITENAKALTLAQKETTQVVEVSNNQLASDKLQSYDEINRKYKALNLKYSKNREDYPSDEVFANFRSVKVGNIKEGILYRGASSIDNSMGRAKYVDKLISEVGVNFDVDLTDNDDKIKRHFSKKDFASNYFKSLYESGKTVLLHMDTNYHEQKYHDRVVKAMIAMSKNEGPYYVHCVEGKNRTGFVLAVIEGLAGASYEEIVKDHMITFANYYGITEETDKEKYDILKARYIDSMLRYIADDDPWTGNGTIELSGLDWVNIMGRYLNKHGMSDEDIHNWYKNVTTK
jgi:hypothetical protein